jgi:hypothetical protein
LLGNQIAKCENPSHRERKWGLSRLTYGYLNRDHRFRRKGISGKNALK